MKLDRDARAVMVAVTMSLAIWAVLVLVAVLANRSTAQAFAADNPKCDATTDIVQFKSEIHKACGVHVKAVAFFGTKDEATYTVTDDRDYAGRAIAGTPFSTALEHAAIASHGILDAVFPMSRFRYSLRDVKGTEVCRFTFVSGSDGPVSGWCLSEVE